MIEFRIGVDTSSNTFYPFGIYAESPSRGGDSPNHVEDSDHLST